MKIVDKETFLQMPRGTVFSEYEPCFFTGLFVKDDEPSPEPYSDYFEQQLIGNVEGDNCREFAYILDVAQATGASFGLDFAVSGRNGMYIPDQLYAIYERKDLESFIATLQESLEVTR